ncbi:MAG: polymer-forming cytoskeletal protein [Candidatus Paceibacterota bacterium]|jgi:hypothetical protein
MNKKLFSLVLLVIGLVCLPLFSQALTFKGGESYYLSQGDKVAGDLYLGASSATIAGEVNGDLFIGGGSVFISGPIKQDLTVAGGSINLNGAIGDDIRAAGGNIVIGGNVGGDLLIFGGQVHLAPGAVVKGEALIYGGMVTIDGKIMGDVKIRGGQVVVNGWLLGKNSDIAVQKSLILGSSARVEGNLTYKAPQEAQIDSLAIIIGETKFEKIEGGTKYSNPMGSWWKKAVGVLWGIKLAMTLLVVLLAVWIFPKHVQNYVSYAKGNFWKEVLRGFLFLVVVPIAVILSFITVIGIPVGGLLLVSYVLSLFVAFGVIASLVLGSLVWQWFSSDKKLEVTWKQAIVGVILLNVLGFIPFVGWIAVFIFSLVSLGVVFHSWQDKVWTQR